MCIRDRTKFIVNQSIQVEPGQKKHFVHELENGGTLIKKR